MKVRDAFGEWVVVETDGRKALCQCSCGVTRWVWKTNLTTGKSNSCGHVRNNYSIPKLGERVGEWTVLKHVGKHHVVAKCDCGVEKKVYMYTLGRDSSSCGHGRRTGPRARLRQMWKWMMSRCYNESDPMYPYYGMKGVEVCKAWRDDPDVYIDWAIDQGFKKNSGRQIDRINNDGEYSPDNCRVTTATANANNKSNNVELTAWGESKTIGEWSRDERCAVSYATLWSRSNKGWGAEDAVSTPARKLTKRLHQRPYH